MCLGKKNLANKPFKVLQRLAFTGGRMSEQVDTKRVQVCIFTREGRTTNKLAKLGDAIAIIAINDPLTHSLTDTGRGRCWEMLSHLKWGILPSCP